MDRIVSGSSLDYQVELPFTDTIGGGIPVIRGWYTGASGMTAQQYRLDAVSNNLANVDVDGYKKDIAVHKAFPELLLRRLKRRRGVSKPLWFRRRSPHCGQTRYGGRVERTVYQF